MAEDSKTMVAFRLSPEMRAGVDAYCIGHGISISDFYRSLTELALNGQIGPGSIEGYKAARAMAIQLAGVVLATAAAAIPETIEEAQARGLVG
jgi:hypothetical protein